MTATLKKQVSSVAQNQEKSSSVDVDMRFRLTPWERESVIRLKKACDEQGLSYNSIFELAKYVLVVKSAAKDKDPRADEKRLKLALKRIKKRRDWEARHGIDQVDPMEALRDFEESEPDYFVSHYLRDNEGRRVCAHHAVFVPLEFVSSSKENKAKYFAVEQWRMDLCAANMEEARRGMAILGMAADEACVSVGMRFIRMLMVSRENIQDMHCHRVRKVYAHVPSFLSHFVPVALKLFPGKMASRVTVVSEVSDLDDLMSDSVPKGKLAVRDWVMDRMSVYEETLEKLSLDE